jgi:hypothetical protein
MKLATLALDGLLIGIEEVGAFPDPVPADRVALPDDHDVPLYGARWCPDTRQWHFIKPNLPPRSPGSCGFFPDGREWRVFPDGIARSFK